MATAILKSSRWGSGRCVGSLPVKRSHTCNGRSSQVASDVRRPTDPGRPAGPLVISRKAWSATPADLRPGPTPRTILASPDHGHHSEPGLLETLRHVAGGSRAACSNNTEMTSRTARSAAVLRRRGFEFRGWPVQRRRCRSELPSMGCGGERLSRSLGNWRVRELLGPLVEAGELRGESYGRGHVSGNRSGDETS